MTSKTRLRKGWAAAVALLLVVPALAQRADRRDEEAQIPPEERSKPVFRLEISPQLLINGINRLVEKRLTKDYGLDEFQAEETRLLLQEELTRFLEEHQAELETLATEWLEAISADEPPSAEFAADWAARLRPIVEEAEVMVERVGDNMREFLDDDQQVLLDGYLAGIDLVSRNVKGRLYEFEQGHFDPEKHWPGNRAVRRRSPAEIKTLERDMDLARRQAMGEPVERIEQRVQTPPSPPRVAERPSASGREPEPAEPEEPATPQPGPDSTGKASPLAKAKPGEKKDEWTLYVEAFIQRYQLNDEQQQKAALFLQRAQAHRDRHLSRTTTDMERIQRLFDRAKNEKELTTAEKAYQHWHSPVDRMFDRLKRDLETLPTRAQYREAGKSEAERREPGKPERKDAAGRPQPQ